MAYLFGDILAVGKTDLAIIWGGALLVLALMIFRWSGLLLATMNPDLAHASGINPRREQLILTIALAIVVAHLSELPGSDVFTRRGDNHLITGPTEARAATRTLLRSGAAQIKIMVGGAPVTQSWADEIGADGYAEDAISAVGVAKDLVGA